MRNWFLLLILMFTISMVDYEFYELIQPDQTVPAGTLLDVTDIWVSDGWQDYNRIVCAAFDGYTWNQFTCNFDFYNSGGVTGILYWFDYQTSVNDKIIDISIGSSYPGFDPVVRRFYIDDGTIETSLFGIDTVQSGFVSPYYAQLIAMKNGYGVYPNLENVEETNISGSFFEFPSIPNPFNAFADSFNNWRSWIDGNFLSKLQFDTSALNNLKPWLMFFAAIMGTVSPVIPVPLLITVTALVAVITNLTILLSIYDRIRKLLI
jgi:hypothetical protein